MLLWVTTDMRMEFNTVDMYLLNRKELNEYIRILLSYLPIKERNILTSTYGVQYSTAAQQSTVAFFNKIKHKSKMTKNKGGSIRKTVLEAIVISINIAHINSFAEKVDNVIYILMWKPAEHLPWPFQILLPARQPFVKRNCSYMNCYVTDDPLFFGDILDYDVLLFDVLFVRNLDMPLIRSERQKYVLVGFEPAGMNVIPEKYNTFFNLTWTYKLDSDTVLPYIVVKNESGQIIGPRKDMHWIKVNEMNETSSHIRNKLQKKRIAAAWFVTNCYMAPSGRLQFVAELQKELAKYGQRVDIYGGCGNNTCAGDECFALIESTYYFYLAFENSFSEDYVSEKVLLGLEHYAVPVVFGTANYTR